MKSSFLPFFFMDVVPKSFKQNLINTIFLQFTVDWGYVTSLESIVCLKYFYIWWGSRQVNENAYGTQQYNSHVWPPAPLIGWHNLWIAPKTTVTIFFIMFNPKKWFVQLKANILSRFFIQKCFKGLKKGFFLLKMWIFNIFPHYNEW